MLQARYQRLRQLQIFLSNECHDKWSPKITWITSAPITKPVPSLQYHDAIIMMIQKISMIDRIERSQLWIKFPTLYFSPGYHNGKSNSISVVLFESLPIKSINYKNWYSESLMKMQELFQGPRTIRWYVKQPYITTKFARLFRWHS